MKTKFIELIRDLQIEELALASNFYSRKPRKITAINFVSGFFKMMQVEKFTLKSWALNIALITGVQVSHQGIAKKLGFSNLKFANALLEKALSHALSKASNLKDNSLLSQFRSVLIQDSTSFTLPDGLFNFFPGSSNQSKKNATGKIQLCIEITKNVYSHIKLMSFRDTDGKYAGQILNVIKKGDLIIRDLGYWNSCTFDLIHQAGAFFLSRLRSDTNIYTADNKELIDIMKYLKAKERNGIKIVERDIFLSRKTEKYRMVCIKLTDKQHKKRKSDYKRRMRNGKDEPSTKKAKYLMSWNIFITNVEAIKLDAKQVYLVYSLRWNIEIIFKHWKSKLKLDNFIKTCTSPNPARFEIIVLLYLTWIVLIYKPKFNYYQKRVYQKASKFLSPTKFADFIKANYQIIGTMTADKLIKDLAYYCCFDERKDRKNYFEKMYMT